MNRQQRRAAERGKKPKLPAYQLNKRLQPQSTSARHFYAQAQQRAVSAGDPPPDHADRERAFEQNKAVINDIVYCRNLPDNLPQMEKFVRNALILFRFYEQTEPFIKDGEAAADALMHEADLRAGSPNQRRELLRPLNWLNALIYVLTQYTPGSLLLEVAHYGTGMQMRDAYTSFWEKPKAVCESTLRVIRGESLRTLAKSYGIKEPQLRIGILQAAKDLYRIGECLSETEGLTPAQGIPDLRGSAWQPLGNPTNLTAAHNIGWDITERFEISYGIVATLGLAKRERALSARSKKH